MKKILIKTVVTILLCSGANSGAAWAAGELPAFPKTGTILVSPGESREINFENTAEIDVRKCVSSYKPMNFVQPVKFAIGSETYVATAWACMPNLRNLSQFDSYMLVANHEKFGNIAVLNVNQKSVNLETLGAMYPISVSARY